MARAGLLGIVGVVAAATPWACSLFTDLNGFSGGLPDAELAEAQPGTETSTPVPDGAPGLTDGAGESGSEAAPDGNGDAYAALVLSDGPIAYYRFDEASGIIAHDASGHGNDATIGAGVTWGAAGAIVGDADTAIHVADGSAGVNAGQRFDFAGTVPFSLEGWVMIETIDGSYRFFFSKDYTDTAREEYGVVMQGHDGLFVERIIDGTSANVGVPAPSTSPPTWIHLVATYDGASLAFYVNGASVGTAPDARSQPTKPVGAFIGDDPQLASMVGVIDEVAVYDKALGADRVAAHFNAAGAH
jgi:Concanavalin A-like lectin/glucanases superfamily